MPLECLPLPAGGPGSPVLVLSVSVGVQHTALQVLAPARHSRGHHIAIPCLLLHKQNLCARNPLWVEWSCFRDHFCFSLRGTAGTFCKSLGLESQGCAQHSVWLLVSPLCPLADVNNLINSVTPCTWCLYLAVSCSTSNLALTEHCTPGSGRKCTVWSSRAGTCSV